MTEPLEGFVHQAQVSLGHQCVFCASGGKRGAETGNRGHYANDGPRYRQVLKAAAAHQPTKARLQGPVCPGGLRELAAGSSLIDEGTVAAHLPLVWGAQLLPGGAFVPVHTFPATSVQAEPGGAVCVCCGFTARSEP